MNIPENGNIGIWISAYLYYAEPWEPFLALAVKPFIDNLHNRKQIIQYFFIRYWERGPHIRLRIKVSDDNREKEIVAAINSYFIDYFHKHPSKLPDVQSSKSDKNYPNNSIQFISYEPETERYGGLHGITPSEKMFEISSNIVLNIIAGSYTQWSYSAAMGSAIELHLAFLYRAGMTLEEVIAYANYYINCCISLTVRVLTIPGEDKITSLLKSFGDSFDKQKEQIIPGIHSAWANLQNGRFSYPWLHQWSNALDPTLDQLHHLSKTRQLTTSEGYIRQMDAKEANKFVFWSIINSYVHMTNNRLGIKVRDEAFIMFILKSSLQESVS